MSIDQQIEELRILGERYSGTEGRRMDDDFEPRLGRMRGRGNEARYLSLVVKAARRTGRRTAARSRRFDGSRIGRGAGVARVLRSGDRHAAFRARRVIVKARLAMLAGNGLSGAKAHLRYIERCGGDRHQFRFIVSVEDGDQYPDLKPFTRRLMRQMEEDLGTRLEWVAVDHFNTGHPHTHIMLRGRDDRGENLVIAREYISHGLRERASRLVTLDLGPRTDLGIEERLRSDTGAERLTAIDRRLIRDMDTARIVSASDTDPFQQSLRAGRLQKLGAMGLAESLGASRWRLADGLVDTLRRIGERGDIIRTMQRELTARKLERATADRVIFDLTAEGAASIVGRVIVRGLADELDDRHYLIVDGIDGRTHFAEIGTGEGVEPIPDLAIVRIAPRSGGVRPVDRIVAEVAAANGGRYTVDAHLRHDPSATQAFAETPRAPARGDAADHAQRRARARRRLDHRPWPPGKGRGLRGAAAARSTRDGRDAVADASRPAARCGGRDLARSRSRCRKSGGSARCWLRARGPCCAGRAAAMAGRRRPCRGEGWPHGLPTRRARRTPAARAAAHCWSASRGPRCAVRRSQGRGTDRRHLSTPRRDDEWAYGAHREGARVHAGAVAVRA